MLKDMAFYHLPKKCGDKYGKNLMDTSKKNRNGYCENGF